MNPPCPRDIISRITEVGSLPQTLAAVLKALNNPSAGADEIAETISKDVSLTSRVLRMVNSAQFGRRRKVTKISEAVIVIGLNSVKVLTLSSSVFGMVADKELINKFNIKKIWRHLIETAAAARSLAVEAKYREPEEAFVAAIMHDIGVIVMLLYFKEKYLEVVEKLKQDRQGIIKTEEAILGTNHCAVGAELVNLWNIPARLGFVVQNHHTSEPPDISPEETTLNRIVSLADRLTLGPFDRYFPEVEDNIAFIQKQCRNLEIDSAVVNRIRKDALMESVKLAEYLELEIGDILDILMESNDKLAELYFSLEKVYLEKQSLQMNIDMQAAEPLLK